MSGILSSLGQLHFLHERRNENVKRVVGPPKVKPRVGNKNNTLEDSKFFTYKRSCGGNEICALGQKLNLFQFGRSQTWVINLGEWGFERWRHLTGREGQKERCYPVTLSQLSDPSFLKPGLCEGLKVRRSGPPLLPPPDHPSQTCRRCNSRPRRRT